MIIDRWVDNALDTKQVIDILKLKEKGQVFGIGHSMGASCMILAESLFPGTFDGLCLIEAAVRRKVVPFQTRLKDPIYASINRRDEWPNSFHPEALENYVKYGMYDTNHGTVKLKCPKEHEFHMFMCSSMESAMSFTASKTLRIPTHYVFATKSFLKDAKMEYALIQSNSYNTVEYIEGSHMIACEIPDIIVSSSLKRESDFMSEIETLRLENAKLKKQAEQASANLKRNETEQLSPPPTPKSLKEPKKRSRQQEEEERPQKKKMVRQEREKSNYLNMTPYMPSPLADNIMPENLLMNMYDPSYMMNPFMSTFYNPDQLFNDQVNFLS
ncbi:hypothetical protein G6F56_010015 [Rhizopus delemar]|nr:hypothetical protein G6F56_010015 [Rhizopus delemar]